MKQLIFFSMVAVLAVGCAPSQSPEGQPTSPPPEAPVTSPPENGPTPGTPFAPQPGDENLSRGEVFINEADLIIRESFPPQIVLHLNGDLPTPCHQLRVVIPAPDAGNRINVEAYSVVDPNQVCTQVLAPFEENIELGTFASGHYTVLVNGEVVGEFDS